MNAAAEVSWNAEGGAVPIEFIKLCIGNTSEFPSLTTKPEITNDGCDTSVQKET